MSSASSSSSASNPTGQKGKKGKSSTSKKSGLPEPVIDAVLSIQKILMKLSAGDRGIAENQLLRHLTASGAQPSGRLPPEKKKTQKVGQKAKTELNRQWEMTPEYKEWKRSLDKKGKTLVKDLETQARDDILALEAIALAAKAELREKLTGEKTNFRETKAAQSQDDVEDSSDESAKSTSSESDSTGDDTSDKPAVTKGVASASSGGGSSRVPVEDEVARKRQRLNEPVSTAVVSKTPSPEGTLSVSTVVVAKSSTPTTDGGKSDESMPERVRRPRSIKKGDKPGSTTQSKSVAMRD